MGEADEVNINGESWPDGDRRMAKRRYMSDRRQMEKRKHFWNTVILPVLIGIAGAGIISWAAYVTHTTYTISAKYEANFVKHMEKTARENLSTAAKIDNIILDYNTKITGLHDDMSDGFRELRESQQSIYNLLVEYEAKRSNKQEN